MFRPAARTAAFHLLPLRAPGRPGPAPAAVSPGKRRQAAFLRRRGIRRAGFAPVWTLQVGAGRPATTATCSKAEGSGATMAGARGPPGPHGRAPAFPSVPDEPRPGSLSPLASGSGSAASRTSMLSQQPMERDAVRTPGLRDSERRPRAPCWPRVVGVAWRGAAGGGRGRRGRMVGGACGARLGGRWDSRVPTLF